MVEAQKLEQAFKNCQPVNSIVRPFQTYLRDLVSLIGCVGNLVCAISSERRVWESSQQIYCCPNWQQQIVLMSLLLSICLLLTQMPLLLIRYISPLMAQYWCFNLQQVADRVQYLKKLEGTESASDIHRVIHAHREQLFNKKGQYVGPRPARPIEY